jgi:predicted nucleic acid-binding protein
VATFVDTNIVLYAISTAKQETEKRFGISYWDAAIIEAARCLGCSELLTEDLQDHQSFDGVRAINPLR